MKDERQQRALPDQLLTGDQSVADRARRKQELIGHGGAGHRFEAARPHQPDHHQRGSDDEQTEVDQAQPGIAGRQNGSFPGVPNPTGQPCHERRQKRRQQEGAQLSSKIAQRTADRRQRHPRHRAEGAGRRGRPRSTGPVGRNETPRRSAGLRAPQTDRDRSRARPDGPGPPGRPRARRPASGSACGRRAGDGRTAEDSGSSMGCSGSKVIGAGSPPGASAGRANRGPAGCPAPPGRRRARRRRPGLLATSRRCRWLLRTAWRRRWLRCRRR